MRTLLIFAREPRSGKVKTRLGSSVGADVACSVYRAFLGDIARRFGRRRGSRRAEMGVEWWVDGNPEALRSIVGGLAALHSQGSGDLGMRLERAFADAFRRTGGPIGVIGTDCPELTRRHVDALFSSLRGERSAALIPATDGGYIAMAVTRHTREAFTGIPWSTGQVLAATARALRREGFGVSIAPPLSDVDTLRDLADLARRLADRPSAAPETAAVLESLALLPAAGSVP